MDCQCVSKSLKNYLKPKATSSTSLCICKRNQTLAKARLGDKQPSHIWPTFFVSLFLPPALSHSVVSGITLFTHTYKISLAIESLSLKSLKYHLLSMWDGKSVPATLQRPHFVLVCVYVSLNVAKLTSECANVFVSQILTHGLRINRFHGIR